MTPEEQLEALRIARERGLLSQKQSAAVQELERRRGIGSKQEANRNALPQPSVMQLQGLGAVVDDLSLTQRYHLDTLKKGAARQNRDGSITTVYAVGIPYNGMIYNVPSYDNETGQIITDQNALLERWLPAIKSGEVKGYPEKFDGDIKQHPANVAARNEHHWVDENPGSFEDVGFNMRWKNRGLID
jgi:hypothetical protein